MDHARTAALASLKTVIDPELGLDIVELGLLYRLAINDSSIQADMTLTTRGCPMGEMIVSMAGQALAAVSGGRKVALSVVWEPSWSPEMLGAQGRLQLGRSVA